MQVSGQQHQEAAGAGAQKDGIAGVSNLLGALRASW